MSAPLVTYYTVLQVEEDADGNDSESSRYPKLPLLTRQYDKRTSS